MKELEETNCEIRNVIKFQLSQWDWSSNSALLDEQAITDGSKESNFQISGGFLNNSCKYAWLSRGSHLVVVEARCGKCISSWNFPNKITTVSSFPAEPGEMPLLLVGLDNNAIRIKDSIGHLCIFNCCTSTVLADIEVPAGVERACIIHGGAEWEEYNEKRPDTLLPGNTGLIFAALRNLQHIVIDINRFMWKNIYYDSKFITAKVEFVNNTSPKSGSLNKNKKEPVHVAYNLMDKEIEQYMGFDRSEFEATLLYDESLCSILLSCTKIGCLITGCLGRLIIWQSDGSIGWISPPFDENAYVTHVALLEPSDDPRPFYYLWIACQGDSPESSAVLRMYAMLFNKKHYDKAGESCLYYNLESEPSLKFELELEQGERVHSLLPIERESLRDTADPTSRRGEDSLLFIGSDERILLFDLNRWYKEQMPRTITECRNPNSVMASYRTKINEDENRGILSCCYVPRSLREFPAKGPTSPEELFFPNSLTIEWVELGPDNFTHWLARGLQADLLREITIAGPIVLVKPTETYRRCLAAGLVPFNSSTQDYSLDTEKTQQRELLLSLCLEQRWANFLVRCATEWSDGSAAFLYPEFIRWGVQRASAIKLFADQLCVPLFDQSGSNIGESEVKTLRFCEQQLECLTNVVSKLPNLESDLEKHRRALKRITTYFQVLLWFYDVGLLPETQELEEDDSISQITLSMKIPYPKVKLTEIYKKIKENNKCEDDKAEPNLFINQLIFHNCLPLREQWKNEADSEQQNETGCYPPPSLQSLLRSYLTDCHQEDIHKPIIEDEDGERDILEMESKHSITIYLLMDLAMVLQSSYPGVDRLIKYPSAFKLSPSLIKLTQAFWFLDHEDYEGFFKIMTGQLILSSDIKDWHHKLAIKTLLKSDQHKLALSYLRILKPPLNSMEDQATLISLSVEQGLVESAFHARPPSHYAQLLTRFFEACKTHGKLKEILHLSLDNEEEEAFVKFLKEEGCEDTRLLYYLQRCRHTEASDVFDFENTSNSRRSIAPRKIHPTALKMLSAFNATLPDITKRFASTFSKSATEKQRQIDSSTGGYPRPMSHCRNKTKGIYEVAVNKARETCFKSDRIPGLPTHLPFLGAPCASIVYYMRGLNEPTDANCVIYPERKVHRSKRNHDVTNVEDDIADGVSGKKRRRLSNGIDSNISRDDNEEQMTRRLSMSQVCNTPLVQRKIRLDDGRDTNSQVTETPHSILKIRQMIRHNSNSPGYSINNCSSSENDFLMSRATSEDRRPARQIRFSVNRHSANDDSVFTNESIQDEIPEGSISSKNADEDSGAEESYYSPNVSEKTYRDISILSDTSYSVFIRGPRPRPGLRRSLLSRTSSDYQSHSLSENSTINVSSLDCTNDEKQTSPNTSITSPCKSEASPSTHYHPPFLSPNTSIESSPIKALLLTKEQNIEEESEESESVDELEDDEETDTKNDSQDGKAYMKVTESNEEEKICEKEIKDASSQHDESERMSIDNLLQENDISEDDETEKDVENICQQDDVFQSFSSSHDNSSLSKSPANCIRELQDQIEQNTSFSTEILTRTSTHIYTYKDSSISKNISLEKTEEYTSMNYSLTKPILAGNRGISRNDSFMNITDDESMSPAPTTTQDEEEADITLNLSGSDSSDGEKQDQFTKTSPKKKRSKIAIEARSSELSDSSIGSESFRKENITTKSEKLPRSRQSSMSSTKSEEIVTAGTPVRRSTRQKAAAGQKEPISVLTNKSLSTSPTIKMTKDDRNKRSTSVTKEVKKILSKVIREPISSEPSSKPIEEIIESDAISKTLDNQTSKKSRAPVSRSSHEPLLDKLSIPIIKIDYLEENLIPSNIVSLKGHVDTEMQTNVSEIPAVKTRTDSVVKESEVTDTSVKLEDEPTGKKTYGKSMGMKTSTAIKKTKTAISKKDEHEESNDDVEERRETVKPSRSKTTRASSLAKETIIRKTRANSVVQEESPVEKSNTRKTRAGSVAQDEEAHVQTSNPRKTRAGSVAQEIPSEQKSIARKTRGGSVSQETGLQEKSALRKTRAGSVAQEELLEEKSITRKTRAGSVAQELPEEKSVGRKTRAASISQEEETLEKPSTPVRRTRAASIAKDEQQEKPLTPVRRTRATSLAKDETTSEELPTTPVRRTRGGSFIKEIPRKTRATSLVKETEEAKTPTKRSTRASSVAKESQIEVEEAINKRPTRKRGGSLPKDVSAILESQRSTSLLKEVILEESISQIESPAVNRRNKLSHNAATSSPATNTRSRRISVQSEPDEMEEIFAITKASNSSKDDSRSRRAASVDSNVSIRKRLTRSALAKNAIVEESIPEEATQSPVSKKQPTRRKRTTSTSLEQKEEKPKTARPKRGRKVSESKDFQFSLPDEAGEVPDTIEDEGRTPIYKFSEPTGLEKFITVVKMSTRKSSDVMADALTRVEKNKNMIWGGSRTGFKLPKRRTEKI